MEAVTSSPPAIRAVDLAKSFGDVEALTGVSFEVPAGTVLGLLPPHPPYWAQAHCPMAGTAPDATADHPSAVT